MIDKIKLSKTIKTTNLSREEINFLEKNFPWCDSKKEAIFCLRNDLTETPRCQYRSCNNLVRFHQQGKTGYSKGCCKDHNYRITNLKKYGVENVKQNPDFVEKSNNTFHSRTDEQKEESKRKFKKTMLEIHGVENPSFLDSVKKTISEKNKKNASTRKVVLKNNMRKKYGVDNVFQLDEVKEKTKITLKNKLGVENPSQSEEIKLKKEKTCLKNFGVRHPQQNDEIFEKTQKHRWKDYQMPSGKIIKIQGYEHFALDMLLKQYDESELVLERKKIPKVWYGEKNKHKYTTDIFIPKENKFIEVKSPYTFSKYLEVNLLKKKASLERGFNFEFMIFDEKGNIVTSKFHRD